MHFLLGLLPPPNAKTKISAYSVCWWTFNGCGNKVLVMVIVELWCRELTFQSQSVTFTVCWGQYLPHPHSSTCVGRHLAQRNVWFTPSYKQLKGKPSKKGKYICCIANPHAARSCCFWRFPVVSGLPEHSGVLHGELFHTQISMRKLSTYCFFISLTGISC